MVIWDEVWVNVPEQWKGKAWSQWNWTQPCLRHSAAQSDTSYDNLSCFTNLLAMSALTLVILTVK